VGIRAQKKVISDCRNMWRWSCSVSHLLIAAWLCSNTPELRGPVVCSTQTIVKREAAENCGETAPNVVCVIP
jgi:hypothetical protein